ncbi:MAG: methionyl-tRNA formyltransferase [Candidatus Levybacteria bacterium]|nr:methionyl-tRNA formyltransferase [Candidatus Levybacteria bacterium]
MKGKIVFFGAGPYVSRTVEVLIREFEVYVFTTETDRNDPLLLYCIHTNIPHFSIKKFDHEVIVDIKKIGAKIAVLAYFGLIIPDDVLDLFDLGIINIHPSLLPKLRGPTPVQAAILAGEKTTGVSIIKLDEEVDHGPILGMINHTIAPNDTSDSLYRTLFKMGGDLLIRALPKYIAGKLALQEQDHSKATFTERLTRYSGLIDLTKPPQPLQLDRMIRAYYPWPGVWFRTKLNGVERTVKLFPEQKIQVEGKNIMKLSDFANGYPEGRLILSKLSIS